MQIAVWDTYVRRPDGWVVHFDILVPEEQNDAQRVFAYGRDHLASKGLRAAVLETEECRLCHIETPSPETALFIERQGYAIVEMEDIPPELPAEPARRDLILHLRAHYPEYRFADFSGKTTEEIRSLAGSLAKP